MSYDRLGRVHLQCLPVARDLHDVQIIGNETLVVASHENAVFNVPPFGDPLKRWQLPGEPDAWHINCLADHEGEIFTSAFCDGRNYRGWLSCHDGAGLVFSLMTGRVVANGLDMPHSPLFIDGSLLVCNSGSGELFEIDPVEPTRRLRTIDLGGFTRGLAVLGDKIFAGVSARRGTSASDDQRSYVIILDRRSWQITDRIEMQVPEIYDVRIVSRLAVALLDNGADQARNLLISAGTNSQGARPLPGYPTPRLRASGSSVILDAQDRRVKVQGRLPRRMSAKSLHEIGAIFTNLSRRSYPVGVGDDHPVHLSYRWVSMSGKHITPDDEPLRTLLPEDFSPGTTLSAILLVRAPTRAGIYRLCITLVQERGFWFDDANPAMVKNSPCVLISPRASVHRTLARVVALIISPAIQSASLRLLRWRRPPQFFSD
jgi:Domain of unknown function (DUF4915)